MHGHRVTQLTLIVAVSAAAGITEPAAAQLWGRNGVTVRPLPTGGGPYSLPRAINNAGQVAGLLNGVATIFGSDGTTQSLGTLGGSGSEGLAINNAGHVTGDALLAGDASRHAFLYSAGGMQDLGTFGPLPDAHGTGINDADQVVGYSNDRAFLYSGGALHDLGTLGGSTSFAFAINNAGQIVGSSNPVGDATFTAFIDDGTTMRDLGSLGGASNATAINNAGQVVGTSYLTDDFDLHHAFIVSGGGVMQDLGTLGGNVSGANGIDDAGDVVGYAASATDFFYLAAIWESNGSGYTPYSLADIVNDEGNSGWEFRDVFGMSSDGRSMLAYGTENGGALQWVVLHADDAPITATPEPASLLLLGTGLVAMAGLARRLRRPADL